MKIVKFIIDFLKMFTRIYKQKGTTIIHTIQSSCLYTVVASIVEVLIKILKIKNINELFTDLKANPYHQYIWMQYKPFLCLYVLWPKMGKMRPNISKCVELQQKVRSQHFGSYMERDTVCALVKYNSVNQKCQQLIPSDIALRCKPMSE